jgi:hypothetical protein
MVRFSTFARAELAADSKSRVGSVDILRGTRRRRREGTMMNEEEGGEQAGREKPIVLTTHIVPLSKSGPPHELAAQYGTVFAVPSAMKFTV